MSTNPYPPAPRRGLSPLTWVLVVLLAGAALATAYLLGSRSSPTRATVPVLVAAAPAAASSRPLPAGRIVGPGRVEPTSGEIDLTPEMPGVIAAVHVKEGDAVSQGQLLATLRNQELVAQAASAEAAVAIKRANLQKLKNGARPEELQQARANLDEVSASLDLAIKKLAQQKKLFDEGFVSSAAVDEAKTSVETARARRAVLVQTLALVNAGTRSEDIQAARGDLELAQAQLEQARSLLDKASLRSPVNGVVLRLYKHAGEFAGASISDQPVMQVGDTSSMTVRVQVDEADVARVREGSRAQIVAPAYPGRVFGGVVSRVSPRLGAKTIVTGQPTEKHDSRVLDVIITLDDRNSLPVGLRVDAYIDEAPADARRAGSAPVAAMPVADESATPVPAGLRMDVPLNKPAAAARLGRETSASRAVSPHSRPKGEHRNARHENGRMLWPTFGWPRAAGRART